MEMKEKIRFIREFKELERPELENLTGIKTETWKNIELGRQKANEEHLSAIAKLWPQYSLWLLTDETDEERGQISPILERIQQDLKRAGKA